MTAVEIPVPDYMQDETLQIFSDSVGRFLAKHCTTSDLADWRAAGCTPASLWRAAGAAGLLGVTIPPEYGGAGADFRFEAAIIEQLGRYNALNITIPLQSSVIAPYILKYGDAAQRQRYLPSIVAGETIMAIAMTEPGAGSDLQNIKTTAVRDGDAFIINGQKTFISNGLLASAVIIAAKTDAAAGAKGISLFLIDADTPGFNRGRLLDKLGQSARDTVELFFTDMRVPASCLLGAEGAGFAMLMDNLPQERLVIAWQAMAMIEAALDSTLEYVKERKVFGKSILEFQNSQFKLAECKMEATISKVFLHHCTERLLQGSLDAATASMAKCWITEIQGKIVDQCLQLHGGYGYMDEYNISQMYRDARGYRIYGGTNEVMRLIIARSLM